MEDAMLDTYMEDRLSGQADWDSDAGDEGDGYGFDFDEGQYDDDPSPYDGNYSEE